MFNYLPKFQSKCSYMPIVGNVLFCTFVISKNRQALLMSVEMRVIVVIMITIALVDMATMIIIAIMLMPMSKIMLIMFLEMHSFANAVYNGHISYTKLYIVICSKASKWWISYHPFRISVWNIFVAISLFIHFTLPGLMHYCVAWHCNWNMGHHSLADFMSARGA